MEGSKNMSKVTDFLRTAESVVLLLITSVTGMVGDITNGTLADTGIEVLNSILLVMMTMEIVYTVTKSLESHTLVAEPFLIIGAIAAIRRRLVITA